MSKPTRYPFGLALGHENQFNSYGRGGGATPNPLPAGIQYEQVTAGLLAQANTAPDISMGSLFYTNNTGATVISQFRSFQNGRAGALQVSGQIDSTSPPPEGKIIRVFFLDGNTSYAQGGSGGVGNIILTSSDNGIGANTVCDFMASNGSWFQIGNPSRPSAGMGIATFVGAGTASFNASNVTTEVFQGTGTTVLFSISGGQVGQSVILLNNTAGITLNISTGGNILIPGTNAVVVPANGNYTFTRFGNNWFLDRGAV